VDDQLCKEEREILVIESSSYPDSKGRKGHLPRDIHVSRFIIFNFLTFFEFRLISLKKINSSTI
jgi:hypothetical protein